MGPAALGPSCLHSLMGSSLRAPGRVEDTLCPQAPRGTAKDLGLQSSTRGSLTPGLPRRTGSRDLLVGVLMFVLLLALALLVAMLLYRKGWIPSCRR